MLMNWYRAKKAELKVKAVLYKALAGIIENQKPIMKMIQTLFTELKEVSPEELKNEFIGKMAELIHEQSAEDRENAAFR